MERTQTQLNRVAEAAADLGLIISGAKTEYMTIHCNPQPALQVYGSPINHVTNFRYLVSMMASSVTDFKRRKGLAWTAFWKLESLWKSLTIPISTKVKLFNTTCVTLLMYGCESWIISKDMEGKINAFATSCYRIMLNIKRVDRIPNTAVYNMTDTTPLIRRIRTQQLKFLGHILRLPEDEPVQVMHWYSAALYVPKPWSKKTWKTSYSVP